MASRYLAQFEEAVISWQKQLSMVRWDLNALCADVPNRFAMCCAQSCNDSITKVIDGRNDSFLATTNAAMCSPLSRRSSVPGRTWNHYSSDPMRWKGSSRRMPSDLSLSTRMSSIFWRVWDARRYTSEFRVHFASYKFMHQRWPSNVHSMLYPGLSVYPLCFSDQI